PQLGLWTSEALRERTGADVALYNLGGFRGGLAKGPVYVENVHDLVYRNRIVTFRTTGAVLREMLAHNFEQGSRDRVAVSGIAATYEAGKGFGAFSVEDDREVLVALPEWTARHGKDLFGRTIDFEIRDDFVHEVLIAWLLDHDRIETPTQRVNVVGER
ncbi:MAG: 5'-nucleotidase C-terminal domain-containing protein, partial [Planctomycetota bacterium]